MIRNIRCLCLRVSAVCHFNTSSAFLYSYTPKDNSGLYRRLKAIAEDEPDIEKANIDQQSIEELEEDIMQAADLHDEITSEMRSISKVRQFKITERKHFKPPKEPNMLTWAEKEQIRFLHQSDPDKWNPVTLSESFPASPAIIKKLLKVKWKPSNAETLKAHDCRVSDNWVAFHKGQLKVHNLQLKMHLSTFKDRKNGVKIVTDEEAAKITEVILPRPKRTEFLSLVAGFKTVSKTSTTPTTKIQTKQLEDRSYTVERIGSSNPEQIGSSSPFDIIDKSQANYTLEQFRKRLEVEVDKVPRLSEEIKAIIGRKPDVLEHASSSEKYVAPSERFKTDAIVFQRSRKSPLELRDPDNHPNRIRIPKEKWKPGLVYRVNDSFYDDCGYFLYRVPGLKL